MLTRLFDDWNRRRLEQPAGSVQGHPRLFEGRGPVRAAARQLVALVALSIRFLTVASPPTTDTPVARTAASSSGRASLARLLARAGAQPRLPGAHPVSPAAIRRDVAATSGSPFDWSPIRRHAPTLVAWLRPFASAVASVARPAAEADGSTPARSPVWAQQRLVGGAVAVLVLVASVIGVSPVHSPVGGTGNVLGAGVGPRIAIGGGTPVGVGGFGGVQGSTSGSGSDGGSDGGFGGLEPADPASGVPGFLGFTSTTGQSSDEVVNPFIADPLADGISSTDPTVASQDVEGFQTTPDSTPDGITTLPVPQAAILKEIASQGPFLADGTILKPIAVDTTIPDARTLLTSYKVRKGDTLTSIAHHFGISMVTLFWANHLTTNLKTKTDLKVGQKLSVPPVNGVLHIVTDKETLQDISKRSGISVSRIVSANGLKQPTVFVGQWIIIPGAKAKPVPEAAPKPKPVVKPVAKPSTSSSSSSSSTKATPKPVTRPTIRPTYTGGGWVWPAPGGHISQYFHYGHWAIDIADTYGNPVLAAKGGTVIFAGWKNNGGGWQVWISHGNGLYTTYNHMSSLTVGDGQSVAAGHQVGRIGMTGHATGPHLHFEVWIGPIWSGGTRVNPLNYV
jgi:murein DD-endopeptidase MepM/ murein hydrolase activator NlpD